MTKKSNEYNFIAIWQDKLREYDIKIIHKLAINSIIEIIDELSRLSKKLTTKYWIINEEKSYFISEDQKKEINNNDETTRKEENNSIDLLTTIFKKEITEAIILKNWTRITREKHLNAEHDIKKWKKYNWCLFFKNVMFYLKKKCLMTNLLNNN
jgi:uncharacterized ubiquitin-like protein YukD